MSSQRQCLHRQEALSHSVLESSVLIHLAFSEECSILAGLAALTGTAFPTLLVTSRYCPLRQQPEKVPSQRPSARFEQQKSPSDPDHSASL
jgi:hypothetical protein